MDFKGGSLRSYSNNDDPLLQCLMRIQSQQVKIDDKQETKSSKIAPNIDNIKTN